MHYFPFVHTPHVPHYFPQFPVQVPLQNLSGLLRALGKLQEAEPLHWRALELTEAILGLEHPDTLAGEGRAASDIF